MESIDKMNYYTKEKLEQALKKHYKSKSKNYLVIKFTDKAQGPTPTYKVKDFDSLKELISCTLFWYLNLTDRPYLNRDIKAIINKEIKEQAKELKDIKNGKAFKYNPNLLIFNKKPVL